MQRGLTRAGLGRIASDLEWISLAGRYGFQSVDTSPLGLTEQLGSEENAVRYLEECKVRLGSFSLPVEWRSSNEAFRDGLGRLVKEAEASARLGGKACCTYILPSTDLLPAPFMALSTKRLRICAEILAAYGIRLGLEFVGPHHLRSRWKHPFIWTVQETLEWIEAIGCPNVGLLLDSYHWYTTGMTVTELSELRADQIVHVHVNDAPDVPAEQALDNGRLYPGEGVIDLIGFINALRDIGYSGPVAQEVLTAEQPEQPLEELLERSKRGFDKIFG